MAEDNSLYEQFKANKKVAKPFLYNVDSTQLSDVLSKAKESGVELSTRDLQKAESLASGKGFAAALPSHQRARQLQSLLFGKKDEGQVEVSGKKEKDAEVGQTEERSIPPEVARLQEQLKQSQEQLKRQKSLMDTVPAVDLSKEEKKLIQDRKDAITGRYKQLRDKLKGQKNKTALMGLVNLIAQTGMQIAAAQQGLATGRDMSGARFDKGTFMEKLDAIDNRLAELTDKETVRLEDVEKAREDILGRKQKAAEKAKERVADVQRDEQKFANQVMLEQMKQQGKQQEKLTNEQQKEIKRINEGMKSADVALDAIQGLNEESLKDALSTGGIKDITKGYDIGLNELGKIIHSEIKNEDPSDYQNWVVAMDGLTEKQVGKLQGILHNRLKQKLGAAPQQQEQPKTASGDKVRMRFPGDNKVRLIDKDKVDAYIKEYKGQVVDG